MCAKQMRKSGMRFVGIGDGFDQKNRAQSRYPRVTLVAIAFVVSCLTSGGLAYEFAGGTGEPDDPYQIATAEQLISIGSDPKLLDKNYVLVADIDLDPNISAGYLFDKAVIGKRTVGIGGIITSIFGGLFDGNGHRIIHLTIVADATTGSSDYEDVGLFYGLEWGAIVKNLILEDVQIFSDFRDGAVGALAAVNYGVIERCAVSGSVLSEQDDYVGGLVGLNIGTVIGSYANCRVSSDNDMADVGGLVGVHKDGVIQDCYASCVLSSRYGAGGLVGLLDTYWGARIVHCYATSAVIETNALWGGLVGLVWDLKIAADQIESSYFLLSCNDLNDNGLGTPLTCVQMTHQDSFVDWNFWRVGRVDSAWIMQRNGMPRLVWQILRAFQDSDAAIGMMPCCSCYQ